MNNWLNTPSNATLNSRQSDLPDLALAWAGTTLAFSLSSIGGNLSLVMTPVFLSILAIASVVCGLGFVLHELAHRVVARSYGAEAHFIADKRMLGLSLLIALAGAFLAAPGAVWYRGMLSKAQNGKIALAGPVSNFVLSLIFFLTISVLLLSGQLANTPDWLQRLCYMGFTLNAWLGLFNMIPAGPFDGAKVFAWNKIVFAVTVAVGLVLVFVLQNEMVLSTLYALASGLLR